MDYKFKLNRFRIVNHDSQCKDETGDCFEIVIESLLIDAGEKTKKTKKRRSKREKSSEQNR